MKENKSNKLAAMIMAGIAGVSLVGLTGCTINIGSPSDNNDSNSGTTVISNTTSTTNTSVSTTATQKIYFEGYGFEFPSDYLVYTQQGQLIIKTPSSSPNWAATLGISTNIRYSTLSLKAEEVKAKLNAGGYTVSKYDRKPTNGINWLLYEVTTTSGQKMVMGYGELTSNSVIVIAVINKSNTYDYSKLSEISSIIYKAKSSTSLGIASDDGLTVAEIPELDLATLTNAQ